MSNLNWWGWLLIPTLLLLVVGVAPNIVSVQLSEPCVDPNNVFINTNLWYYYTIYMFNTFALLWFITFIYVTLTMNDTSNGTDFDQQQLQQQHMWSNIEMRLYSPFVIGIFTWVFSGIIVVVNTFSLCSDPHKRSQVVLIIIEIVISVVTPFFFCMLYSVRSTNNDNININDSIKSDNDSNTSLINSV